MKYSVIYMNKYLKGFFKSLGLSNVTAHILSILVTEDRAFSLSELAEKSGYVKSHVLYASNILEKMKLIDKSYSKGRLIINVKKGVVIKLFKSYLMRIRESLYNLMEDVGELRQDLRRDVNKVIDEISQLINRLNGDEYG